jgi:hypothetical protein
MSTATIATESNVEQYRPEPIFRVHEIAAEWKLSIDTVQRLFVNEPDVFMIKSGRKRTLRIPQQVRERVWRRMSNKRVM